MLFDAVIFDLDGTLADTLEDIADSMNAALLQLGQPTHTRDAYRSMVGEGVVSLALRALPPEQKHLLDEAVAGFRAHYEAHIVDHTRLFPQAAKVLDALVARGQKIAVLSNKFDAMTQRIVQKCLAGWPIAVVFGERAGVPRKPDPTAALEIATKLGIEPSRIAFVGDTRIDMETAVNAGMYGVGVQWGFRAREELEGAGAKQIAGTAEELIAALQA